MGNGFIKVGATIIGILCLCTIVLVPWGAIILLLVAMLSEIEKKKC